MKLVSFLRFIVNSCIAELDLFKLICKTLIEFLLFSTDSGIKVTMDTFQKMNSVVNLGPWRPLLFEAAP